MALPLLARLRPLAVVYDCMDELSAFAGAPPQLREREAQLMQRADLVLTGGPSLYEAKRHLHANVLCLPSSVDASTSRSKVAPATRRWWSGREAARRHRRPAARLLRRRRRADGPGPGAPSRRRESALERDHGRADRQDRSGSVPQRPNLHWLGQQPYELLPRLIEGWEVGLLPFALNESTRFISPTKTLEYMAAGKPAVSTAIKDVATLYGDVVRIARSADEFIAACAAALEETPAKRCERQLAMQASVARSSWARTAETIHAALEGRLAAGRRHARPRAETEQLS